MTEQDNFINTAAHEYAESVSEPYCQSDLIQAFKAGWDAMAKYGNKRGTYNWGTKQLLLSIPVGETHKFEFKSEGQLSSFRVAASVFKRSGLGVWHVKHVFDEIYILHEK